MFQLNQNLKHYDKLQNCRGTGLVTAKSTGTGPEPVPANFHRNRYRTVRIRKSGQVPSHITPYFGKLCHFVKYLPIQLSSTERQSFMLAVFSVPQKPTTCGILH